MEFNVNSSSRISAVEWFHLNGNVKVRTLARIKRHSRILEDKTLQDMNKVTKGIFWLNLFLPQLMKKTKALRLTTKQRTKLKSLTT